MFIGGIINSGYQDLQKPVLGTLSYSNLVSGSVDLSCTATDNDTVKEFKVYIDAVYSETVVGTVLDNHTVVGIPGGSNIDIFVTAVDINDNESLASNILNIDTIVDAVPVIGTLTYANEDNTTVELSCTATDDFGVVSFNIYVDDILDRNVVGSSLSSYILNGLTKLTTYSIKVEAIDDAGQKSGFSNSVSVTTTEQIIPLESMVARYKFENNTTDSIGNYGSTSTGVSYIAGGVGTSGQFSKASNSHINTGSTTLVGGRVPVSISFLIKQETTTGLQAIYGAWTHPKCTIIRMNGTSFQWYTETGNQVGGTFFSLNDIGVYHHVVCNYDGSTMKVYLDGVDSGVSYSQTGSMGYGGPENEKIGLERITGNDNTLDEFIVWDIILTQEQITELAVKQLAGEDIS